MKITIKRALKGDPCGGGLNRGLKQFGFSLDTKKDFKTPIEVAEITRWLDFCWASNAALGKKQKLILCQEIFVSLTRNLVELPSELRCELFEMYKKNLTRSNNVHQDILYLFTKYKIPFKHDKWDCKYRLAQKCLLDYLDYAHNGNVKYIVEETVEEIDIKNFPHIEGIIRNIVRNTKVHEKTKKKNKRN